VEKARVEEVGVIGSSVERSGSGLGDEKGELCSKVGREGGGFL